jgi:hypothetical protein
MNDIATAPMAGQFGQNLPPEGVEAMMQAAGLKEHNVMLASQMEQANALRGKKGAQGRTVGSRDTYVAANPMEHLADGIRQYQAGKERKEVQAAQLENIAAQRDASKGMAAEYRKAQQMEQQQQQQLQQRQLQQQQLQQQQPILAPGMNIT